MKKMSQGNWQSSKKKVWVEPKKFLKKYQLGKLYNPILFKSCAFSEERRIKKKKEEEFFFFFFLSQRISLSLSLSPSPFHTSLFFFFIIIPSFLCVYLSKREPSVDGDGRLIRLWRSWMWTTPMNRGRERELLLFGYTHTTCKRIYSRPRLIFYLKKKHIQEKE